MAFGTPSPLVERGMGGEVDISGLDDLTTYYLLHRHDFGMNDAPIGACILYALSSGLSDSALVTQFDLLIRTGGQSEEDTETQGHGDAEMEKEDEGGEGTGSTVRLKAWHQRTRASMGYGNDYTGRRVAASPHPRVVPLIDQIHRLMHLWKAGDVTKVNEYLDAQGLRRNALFHQLLQALIELALANSEERSLLESISNHIAARGVSPAMQQVELLAGTE
jgi:hypothetical protein